MAQRIHPFAIALLSLALAATARASPPHSHGTEGTCAPTDTALSCAVAVTPAMAPDGSLLLAWSAGGRVMVARGRDLGKTLSTALAVNPEPEPIDDNGEARPAIAADAKGRVFVAWSVKQKAPFSGTLMFARSLDGGATFEPARPLASDPASQRFATMAAGPDGRLWIAWIDKRWLGAAKAAGEKYRGAALVLAWSEDGGKTFHREDMAAEHHTCECCRLALTLDRQGLPVVMWRHIFPPNVRDHAVLSFADRDHASIVRVAEDDWKVDACPHHGPSIAEGGDGKVHAAWYTQGQKRKGLFYAAAPFAEPRPIGDRTRAPSHPQVLALGSVLWLAWREFDGEKAFVMAQSSRDDGRSWSEARPVASTAGGSDRPILLSAGGRAYLSWATRAEGWRLLPLSDGDRP